MIGLIAAVNPHGVLAIDGQIPWRKPRDLYRFRALTLGSTIVMGRKTWESLGCKELPGRHSIVISKTLTGPQVVDSIEKALMKSKSKDIWIIGGFQVYELALPSVALIDLTIVQDYQEPLTDKVTRFDSFLRGFSWFYFDTTNN
jgi:dihydrofolate reductase